MAIPLVIIKVIAQQHSNMKKTIIGLISILILTGCDDPFRSSSSGDRGKKQELITTVQQKNFATIEPGDIMIYDSTGNKRIIVTENTAVWRQRSSCSGSQDPVAPAEVLVGDVLTVFYYSNDSVFERSRQVIRPYRIEAFRVDCVQATAENNRELTPCQIFEILNNGTPCNT
jgi:hypothetical protein